MSLHDQHDYAVARAIAIAEKRKSCDVLVRLYGDYTRVLNEGASRDELEIHLGKMDDHLYEHGCNTPLWLERVREALDKYGS